MQIVFMTPSAEMTISAPKHRATMSPDPPAPNAALTASTAMVFDADAFSRPSNSKYATLTVR